MIDIKIPELNPDWFHQAAAHQARLTMPAGALGRLLDVGRQLCAIQETLQPRGEPAAVVVLAADHGITAEGVSAYPQEVTGQMVANFLRQGAAINVLARRQGATVWVVDLGIRHLPAVLQPRSPTLRWIAGQAVRLGTGNFLREPAMSLAEVEQAIAVGRRLVVEQLVPEHIQVVALGEMGIGNTTSASALTAAVLGCKADTVTGRGTGLDDARLRHKIHVIDQALERHFPNRHEPVTPLDALAAVGGLEIAGLVGVALEAAARRLVVVLDGFISSVAGLLAVRLRPAARGYLIAGHRSVEAGHRAVLAALDLAPLLDLGMRLGEGSGAALALNLIQSAADVLRDMATFDAAQVSERTS
ncbi:MAG: nicotinate-nucleotide--dimethylbenzimidazole phosphoribosyltransferase [Gemmataceae bacterium]